MAVGLVSPTMLKHGVTLPLSRKASESVCLRKNMVILSQNVHFVHPEQILHYFVFFISLNPDPSPSGRREFFLRMSGFVTFLVTLSDLSRVVLKNQNSTI